MYDDDDRVKRKFALLENKCERRLHPARGKLRFLKLNVMMMVMERKPVKCLRCGNEWTPRVPGRPKQCPSCHQAKWDVAAWGGRTAVRPKGRKKAAA
jgi:hypothetical protein